MFKKISRFINNIITDIYRIKIIKTFMTLITVLLSYRIIKFIWYFNKLIIYFIGLIFVGFNWNDYHIFNEIKLLYDAVKLYILSIFNQDVKIIKDQVISTKKDMKEIIYKDHTNISNEIDNDYVYVIAEKFPEVKYIQNEIKESVITDGQDNIWSFNEIINSPWILFTIASAITISGVIIIYHYDLTLNSVTTYTIDHIKAGFTATILFLAKIIRFFKNNPRPPINPINPDHDINPEIIKYFKDESKEAFNGPMLKPFYLNSNIDNPLASSSKLTLDNKNFLNVDLTKESSLLSFLENKVDNLDLEHPDFKNTYSKFSNQIKGLTLEIDKIFKENPNKNILEARKEGLLRLNELYSKLPSKSSDIIISPISSNGSITPVQTPKININDLPSTGNPFDET